MPAPKVSQGFDLAGGSITRKSAIGEVILANVAVHPSSHDGGELRETVWTWVKETPRTHLTLVWRSRLRRHQAVLPKSRVDSGLFEAVADALDTRITDDRIR